MSGEVATAIGRTADLRIHKIVGSIEAGGQGGGVSVTAIAIPTTAIAITGSTAACRSETGGSEQLGITIGTVEDGPSA